MVTGAAVNAVLKARAFPAAARHALEGSILAVGRAPHRSNTKVREAGLPREESPATATMALREFVASEDILLDVQADRKRAALGSIADGLALRVGKTQGAVLEALLRRERLGPTSISCYASAR